MPFKENLLTKIRIDHLARRVADSLKPSEGITRLDRDAMRELLEMGPYRHQRERDLDLYVRTTESDPPFVLVLDNELPVYRTAIADVVLRKSPTIKEMVNIKNAIKILNDRDVKISRKEHSVQSIRQELISQLDLTFTSADIEEITNDGIHALKRNNTGGVKESLRLFCEMLAYTDFPSFAKSHDTIVFGASRRTDDDKALLGPLITYDFSQNVLTFREGPFDIEKRGALSQMLTNDEPVSLEGERVFRRLQADVLQAKK